MGKMLKDKKELDWLKLENYEYLKTASLMDIFNQLNIREGLIEMTQMESWPDIEESFWGTPEVALNDWEQIVERGWAEHWFDLSAKEQRESDAQRKKPIRFLNANVASLSFNDLRNTYEEVEGVLPYIAENNLLDPEILPYSSYDYCAHKLNSLHEVLHLAIRLDAPDSLILEEVKLLLKNYREAANIPEPEKNHLTPEKLIDQRILPYIDLNIWANMNKIKIPNRLIALVLFPEGEKGEYEVRTSIKENASRAVSQSFQNKLFTMASIEIDKSGKKRGV